MNISMKIADTTTVCAGKRNPENQPLVAMVQERGEVTVTVEGQALVLVRKDKAPFQAFPKDSAGYALLGKLHATQAGKTIPVEVQG
jgi:hypothetical protein